MSDFAFLERGKAHLCKNDKILNSIISKIEPLNIIKKQNHFDGLLDAIISQQLSVKAANAISSKFFAIFNGAPTPENILNTPDITIREAGISNGKIKYIKDLSMKISSGALDVDSLDNLPDEEVVSALTTVKGIGEWTAHMFLIFDLNRPDVLAHGDLGIKKAVFLNYKLNDLPTPNELFNISEENNWAPYRSLACRYLWRSLDLPQN
ncbi:MAG: DNA-3-methyladenine glycosylase 2 family protein [Ignavibacteriaceae bacterium]|nr:DNA-3-methyladenine glycosylase 2 family protein [Ignavibacteriaceae bacterium]